ncbi:MAG TPA: glycosyltransferase family A protein [Candidatus Binataceae bacterium]|nr:glycosyltransferase family A protein [Candidatus Binataceae bacterium]
MTPEVSVVIPTWNRRVMVGEAIESVLAQRGADFELIVVDDGSTDATGDELARRAEISGGRMRLAATRNRGVAAARNMGAAMARAPMVAFLDSDDLWSPGKLACQLAFMRARPDCAICQTEEIWMRTGRRINAGIRNRKRAGDIFFDSLRTCLISPSAVMMRRALFLESGGFDEEMTACEDYDLWLRILLRNQAGLLEKPLVIRRAGHPGQLSATTPALDRFRILALAKLLAAWDFDDPRRDAVVEVMAEKCAIFAKGLARRGDRDRARFFLDTGAAAIARWRCAPDETLRSAIARMREWLRDGGAETRSADTASS